VRAGGGGDGQAPVALVTGGATGIGKACCRQLAAQGYIVVIDHLGQAAAAGQLAAEIGGLAVDADVADAGAMASLVARVEADIGPIEVAVCNAGFIKEVPLDDLNDELWQRTMRVLLGGCVNVIAAVSPAMAGRGHGSIVTISSELALVGATEHAHYVSAKAAIIGLSRSVAKELAPQGIRVNVVAPGPTDTALLTDRWREASYLSLIPLGRLGRPEEVAEVVVAVAGASFLTGEVVSPNGGVVMQ